MEDRYTRNKMMQLRIKREFKDGVSFHRVGLDLYDDGKHLGRVLLGAKKIALYKERQSYTSTMYRRKLTEYVRREFGFTATDIIWF